MTTSREIFNGYYEIASDFLHSCKFIDERYIMYLKANDEKSKRTIDPSFVGEMEYLGKQYIGVIGFDSKRQEDRNFRVDKILEMKLI
jgi:hypothetical protein